MWRSARRCCAQANLAAIGDKGDIGAALADALCAERGVLLLTVPRRTPRAPRPGAVCRLRHRWRQLVETGNDQRTEQFAVGRHHAHTFWGLRARLYTKITAHTR